MIKKAKSLVLIHKKFL